MVLRVKGVIILDYFLLLCSVIIYVENRLNTDIIYRELEKEIGFSLAHIRDVFVQKTGKSLSRYILERRVLNAAFEISHTKETLLTIAEKYGFKKPDTLLTIAEKYGFKNPDTFTRAFKRVIGMTPSTFKKKKITVGRIKLCAGVYGVGLTLNEIQNMKGNENYE